MCRMLPFPVRVVVYGRRGFQKVPLKQLVTLMSTQPHLQPYFNPPIWLIGSRIWSFAAMAIAAITTAVLSQGLGQFFSQTFPLHVEEATACRPGTLVVLGTVQPWIIVETCSAVNQFNDVGWTIVKRGWNSNNYFPESDFWANTKTQLALIDFQLEKFRASAIMVLHSQ